MVSTLYQPRPVVSLGKHLYPDSAYIRRITSIYRSVFNDFGPKFTCVDPTGEQVLSGMIASIDKVDSLLITFLFQFNVFLRMSKVSLHVSKNQGMDLKMEIS